MCSHLMYHAIVIESIIYDENNPSEFTWANCEAKANAMYIEQWKSFFL